MQLNLPEIDLKIREKEEKKEIFDIVRKKFVHLTPEELVRQHFVHYLIQNLCYPKSLMKIESGLTYNNLKKRSDILVYDTLGKPRLLVECKSFKVRVSQNSLDQAMIYNQTIGAEYVVLTNGLRHYCCQKKDADYKFIDSIPIYDRMD